MRSMHNQLTACLGYYWGSLVMVTGCLQGRGWELQTSGKTSGHLLFPRTGSSESLPLLPKPCGELTALPFRIPTSFLIQALHQWLCLPLPTPSHAPCTTSLGIFPFLQGQPFFTEETLLVGRMGTVIPPGLKPHLSGAICFFRRRRRFS